MIAFDGSALLQAARVAKRCGGGCFHSQRSLDRHRTYERFFGHHALLSRVIVVGLLACNDPFNCTTVFDRIKYRAERWFGGHGGAAGYIELASARVLQGKGRNPAPRGDRIVSLSPGGGGLGDPRALLRRDVANEMISTATARDVYCVDFEERGRRISVGWPY